MYINREGTLTKNKSGFSLPLLNLCIVLSLPILLLIGKEQVKKGLKRSSLEIILLLSRLLFFDIPFLQGGEYILFFVVNFSLNGSIRDDAFFGSSP